MSERRVRDDVREYYLAKEPSRATLDRLMAMEVATRQRRPTWTRRLPLAFSGVAAVLLIAVGVWIGLSDRATVAIGQGIAEEIAMNHGKNLEVEFQAPSYAELRQAMDRLDFSLVEPERIVEHGARLLGARYCSIHGQLAAQLRLEMVDGRSVTLYQTAYTDDLEGLEWQQLRADGLAIDIWREGDVFMGMARGL